MWMDADGRIQPGEPLDAAEGALGRCHVPAGDEDALEAGQPGATDDLVRVGLEPVRIEVAVTVDEGRQERVSWYSPSSLPSGSRTAAYRP